MQSAAVIVAAGRGRRAAASIPKQYVDLGRETILRRSVNCFLTHDKIDTVQVVIHPDDRSFYDQAMSGLSLSNPVDGGASRQESAYNGLKALTGAAPRFVLIHDAARPFVSAALIDRSLAALRDSDGAVPGLPVADTLKRVEGSVIRDTVDRTGLWRVQTPQAFRFDKILKAHEEWRGQSLSDDAAVAEAAGLTVSIIPGEEENFKVTEQADIERARRTVSGGFEMRMGQGYDVHRFEDGGHVWLAGVKIPHSRGLKGHSDADAGLHAVTDAILGALAAGDIGDHFPPGDPAWKDQSSDVFLAAAAEMVAKRNGCIINVDLTVICEQPKLKPHRDSMRRRIAEILKIDPSRVSVKATTTEGLGFLGRGEGIAAQAVAGVLLPADGHGRE